MGREAKVSKPRTTKGGTTVVLTASELKEVTRIYKAEAVKGAK